MLCCAVGHRDERTPGPFLGLWPRPPASQRPGLIFDSFWCLNCDNRYTWLLPAITAAQTSITRGSTVWNFDPVCSLSAPTNPSSRLYSKYSKLAGQYVQTALVLLGLMPRQECVLCLTHSIAVKSNHIQQSYSTFNCSPATYSTKRCLDTSSSLCLCLKLSRILLWKWARANWYDDLFVWCTRSELSPCKDLIIYDLLNMLLFLLSDYNREVASVLLCDGNRAAVFCFEHSEPDQSQGAALRPPVLTWMTPGKGNKEIRRENKGSGKSRMTDRQSIIIVKMISPLLTFTTHQVFRLHMSWRNAPQGSLQLTLTVRRPPPHPFPAKPMFRHVGLGSNSTWEHHLERIYVHDNAVLQLYSVVYPLRESHPCGFWRLKWILDRKQTFLQMCWQAASTDVKSRTSAQCQRQGFGSWSPHKGYWD